MGYDGNVRPSGAGMMALVSLGGAAACGRYGFDDHVPRTADAQAIDAAAIDAPPDAPPADLQISLTVDIGYVLSVGTDTQLLATLGGVVNGQGSANDITSCPVGLGPEEYTFVRAHHPTATFVYVAAWDDELLERGFVGVLHPIGASSAGSHDILTGDAGWQVCATGDYPGPAGPLADDHIAAGLASCNAAAGPSKGWLAPAGPLTTGAVGHELVGPDQSTGMPLSPVCSDPGGVPLTAKWIWYHPTLTDISGFQATQTNDDQGFLIFRYPI